MRFRLVAYVTHFPDKHDAVHKYEYLGDKESIYFLWFQLSETFPHVEVFNLAGIKQRPEKGLEGLVDYNP